MSHDRAPNDRMSHDAEPGGDDRSLRDHGRHLAMDSLLELAIAGTPSPLTQPSRRVSAWAAPAAIAAKRNHCPA